MYQRWQKVLVIVAPFAVLAVCALIAWFVLHYVTLLPCPSYTLLHIYCPGCGSTRAVGALMHGDVLLSLRQNPAIVVMLLLAALYYLEFALALYYLEFALKVWGVRFRIPLLHNMKFIAALLVLWVAYAVVRNFVPAVAPI